MKNLRNFPLKITLAVFIISLFLAYGQSGAFAGSGHIMLQSFGWDSMNNNQKAKWYDLIASRAADIAEAGFTLVWFPPPSNSVSQQGYLPTDYYNLGTETAPTFYGTLDTLKNAIKKLHENKVLALADIVINHRCAGKQDANGLWNVYQFPSGKAAWNNSMICGDDRQFDGRGANDTGDTYGAAPDIDHNNRQVQTDIIEWLNWLKTLGFDGWRYDYVKGYAPGFVEIYDKATSPKFSVGELWTSLYYGKGMSLREAPQYNQDGHRQQLCDWLDKSGKLSTTFDFTTKGILQHAVLGEYWRLRDKDGKAAGLIGWWPERAVTFIDNHDTGSKQQHWPFPSDRVMTGYAYILTHPGIPCVFWEHYFDWNLKDQIKKLMAVRQKYGITSSSKLQIANAEVNLYVGVIDSKLIVKLGSRDWSPGEGFKLLASGVDYAVWGK
ncbi:MAG TPA: alpha-amylase C-terminal beta-sheet domain-containing protein [Candidatus Wallbacteria bacterium]|nr:alpha-amylase C-terminal beta-sheet domain-containing protein [Candidatus Wallbacteria bacterium]